MNKFLDVVMFFLKHSTRATGRTHAFLHYFRIGKGYGYPTCCVVHFALNMANGKHDRYPARERGSIVTDEKHYVPCGLHIRRNPNWRAWDEDRNRRQLRLFTMEPKR